MSVRTTADELRDEAASCVRRAEEILGQMLDEDPWGIDQFNREYLEDLSLVRHELFLIRKRIKE